MVCVTDLIVATVQHLLFVVVLCFVCFSCLRCRVACSSIQTTTVTRARVLSTAPWTNVYYIYIYIVLYAPKCLHIDIACSAVSHWYIYNILVTRTYVDCDCICARPHELTKQKKWELKRKTKLNSPFSIIRSVTSNCSLFSLIVASRYCIFVVRFAFCSLKVLRARISDKRKWMIYNSSDFGRFGTLNKLSEIKMTIFGRISVATVLGIQSQWILHVWWNWIYWNQMKLFCAWIIPSTNQRTKYIVRVNLDHSNRTFLQRLSLPVEAIELFLLNQQKIPFWFSNPTRNIIFCWSKYTRFMAQCLAALCSGSVISPRSDVWFNINNFYRLKYGKANAANEEFSTSR